MTTALQLYGFVYGIFRRLYDEPVLVCEVMSKTTATDVQPVLDAAMALVAADGLRGLSLRPLAERMGTTVSALSHRFGRKDALVATLIDAACAADGAFLDSWRARIDALDARDAMLTADLADAVLGDMAGPEALRTRFYCELLQGAPLHPEIAVPLAAWQVRRLSFWRAVAAPLGSAELGEVLHAFCTDEAAHGVAIGDLAAYRWLRRLNLRRLCAGLVPAKGATDLREFAVFHAALGDLLAAQGRYRAPMMTDFQARAARHVSALIVEEGADAVTHRAVAARAGIANSTLAYHFPRQDDLLLAGLHDIILRTQRRIDAPQTSEPDYELSSVEIARATFALALAAARMPSLRGFAADMRRRRGENYLIRLDRLVEGESPFDLLSAQAIAMTGIGQLILDGVLDPAANASAFALIGRLQATAFPPR
jgi:AcrR family transcriptional regulator